MKPEPHVFFLRPIKKAKKENIRIKTGLQKN
jgi:hypothetical protein